MGLGFSLCLSGLALGAAGLLVGRERNLRAFDRTVLKLLRKSDLPWCFLPWKEVEQAIFGSSSNHPAEASFGERSTSSVSEPLSSSRSFFTKTPRRATGRTEGAALLSAGVCSESFQVFLEEAPLSWEVLTQLFRQSGSSPFQTAVQCVFQYGTPVVCALTLKGKPYNLRVSVLKGEDSGFPVLEPSLFSRGLLLVLEDASADLKAKTACAQATRQARTCMAVLNALPFPLWMRNRKGRLTFCNKAYAKELETQPHNVLAHQWELIDGSDARAAKGLFRKVLEADAAQSLRVRKQVKGVTKTFILTEIPFVSATGASKTGKLDPAVAFVGAAADISQPAEDLHTVQEALSLFKALLREIHTPFCVFDAKGRLLSHDMVTFGLSETAEAFLRQRPALEDILELLRERNQLPEYLAFAELKDICHGWITHQNLPFHDVWYLPSGQALDLQVKAHQDKTLILATDVSQTLAVEGRYKLLRKVWNAFVDQAPDALLVVGIDHRIQRCSQAMLGLLGEDSAYWMGRSVKEFLTVLAERNNLPVWRRTLEDAIELRKPYQAVLSLEGRILECAYAPLPDGGHRLSFFPRLSEESEGVMEGRSPYDETTEDEGKVFPLDSGKLKAVGYPSEV